MSGPPPPPPPPGPPPPPAMAPPQLSKSDQHGRSALLTDISKGAKLKSAKHLMNDRSGLQVGGNAGKGGGGGGGAGNRPVMPPGCENGRVTTGRGPGPAGGRQPNAGGGGGGGGAGGTGTVRNAPPGLGDLFGGGIPKLRGTGSNTVGRSVGNRGGDRASNGSVDNFPPPPPPTNKHSTDYSDGGSSTVGRSSGNRMSGGLPPPPSPSQLSRPLPGVPGTRPSGPPPPPTRAPPPPRPHENGSTPQGHNRALPQTPSLPPKPPERKDSVGPPPNVGPPPPPFRANPAPPPPPNRGPVQAPLPVRPPAGGRSGPPTGPPPPPGPMRATNAPPPPPPPGRPPVSVNRTNSMASSMSEFETMFQFPTDLPHPDHFTPSNKTYPSQNPGRKGSANANRRPVPPPPPPGGP